MTSTIDISFYKNSKDNKGSIFSVSGAIAYIRECKSQNLQNQVRACTDKKERAKLKQKLPAVTWSGYFETGRGKELLTRHSGIICLDIDSVDNLDAIAATVSTAANTYCFFTSPSGNGIKVLYRVHTEAPITAKRHEELWAGLAEIFFKSTGVAPDESGKDVSRLCYLPADAGIVVNENATILDEKLIDVWITQRALRIKTAQAKLATKEAITDNEPTLIPLDEMERLYKFSTNVIPFTDGNRNNFIHLYANNANRWGIDRERVLSFWASRGYGPEDIAHATIVNTYARNAAQFGSYKKEKPGQKMAKYSRISGIEPDSETEDFDDEVKFWFEVENEKTGKVEIKFSYDDCVTFLTRNGFYKYPLEEDYQLIHVTGRIVTIVKERHIREFIFRYLKSEDDLKAVREMMRRGAKTYLSTHLFEQLEYLEPDMKRDTKEECFIYYHNCYLKVSADQVQKKEYETLDGCIWSKQIIDFNYEEVDYLDADFYKFLHLSMNGYYVTPEGVEFQYEADKVPVSDEERETGLKRIKSICSGIGYTLHGWKDPSKAKAFVAVDRAKSRAGEPNGRTGKSLLAKAFAKMINVCTLDGPNFKFDKDFAFQKANVDTKLINFNDVTPNFDFNKLFGMITEEFSFEKKRLDQITIPFKDSPKFYVSTNFTLKGDGESNIGRQFMVEFGSYFTSERTPVTVFGRRFFDEWEEMEYCRFYSFMMYCIKIYLKSGLVDFPLESYAERKLTNEAGEEFLLWMDEIVTFEANPMQSSEFEKKTLHIEYMNRTGIQKTSSNRFHKFLHDYAKLRGYVINKHCTGGRDRRGGTDYITFYK